MSRRRSGLHSRQRWISTATKFKYAEAFQSVGRRRMFRQVVSRSKNIVCTRIFDSDVCGIAVVHQDGQVILIDKGSGKIQHDTFIEAVDAATVKSGAFARKSPLLALYTTKKRLMVFDYGAEFEAFEQRLSINVVPLSDTKKCTLRVITWSRDDSLIAAGGEDRVARVYNVRTGVLLHRIANSHADIIVGMDFHPTGRFLATGSKDKRARVFDLSQSEPALELEHNAEARCYAVAFSPDGSRLAVGADNNKTVLIDLKSQRIRATLHGHRDYVRAIMFTPDGRRLLSGGKDGQLFFFDVSTGQPLLPIRNIGWTVMMAQSSDGYQFVTAAQDKSSGPVLHLNIFNIFHDHTSDMIMTMKLASPVTALCFSRDGEKMFSGGKNGVVSMHDITTFQEEVVLRLHNKAVTGVAAAPSGHVASVSEDGALVVFEAANPNGTATTVHTSKTPLTCTAISPCGRWLACANSAGCLFVFDENNELVCHYQVCDVPISAIDFGCLHRQRSGSANDSESPVTVTGAKDGKGDNEEESGGTEEGCVDTLLLAIACHNKTTVVLNVAEAVQEHANGGLVEDAIRFVVSGHEKEVYSVSFSIDGAYLATGSRDKTVRIVEVDSGQVISKLRGHVDHIKGVCFTPKDEVVSASLDCTCRVVPLDENVEDQNARFVELPSSALSIDAAPTESRFAQLVAVGCSDSRICFIDFSFTNQQPLFREAQMIAERAKSTGDYSIVRAMVRRYPLVVHSEDRRGNTLCHYAVTQENDVLLSILLSAKVPQFWLPVNADGYDILHLAVSNKSRSCVKLILDRIIQAKEHGQLCRLPSRRDRFLRTLLQLADDMDDLLAQFLKQFGLDDAPGVLLNGDQLSIRAPRTVIMPSSTRLPEGMWNTLYEEDRLGEKDVGKVVRLQAKYLSIPNFAGLIRTSGSADPVTCLKDTVLHRFVRTGNAQLFGNPLLKMVLDYKWQAYAGRLFMRELAIFGAFLSMFTIFSLTAPRTNLSQLPLLAIFSDSRAALSVLAACVIPLFCYRQLKNEYRQLVRSTAVRFVDNTAADARNVGYDDDDEEDGDEMPGRDSVQYVPHKDPVALLKGVVLDGWNLLQSGTALLALLSVLLFLLGSRWFIPITSASSFFLWLEVLYFLRAFEFTGGLVRMVFKIFYYTGPFLLILVVVLFGTANCFHVLFSSIPPSDEALFRPDDTVMESIFKTFKLLLLGDGAVDEGLPPDDSVSGMVKLLFAVFMVVVNIFMLNLMINLMDDFMQKINDEEGDAFPFEKARIIAEIELSMGDELLGTKNFFPRWLHMLSPKGGELGENHGSDEWQGTVQAIRTENATLERRTRETMDRMQTHVVSHMDAIEKRQADKLSSLDDRVNNKIEAMADTVNRIAAYQVALLEALPPPSGALTRVRSHRSSSGSMRSPSSTIRSRRLRPQVQSQSEVANRSRSQLQSTSEPPGRRKEGAQQSHSMDQALFSPSTPTNATTENNGGIFQAGISASLQVPSASTPAIVDSAAAGTTNDSTTSSSSASAGRSVRRRVLPPRQDSARRQHFRRKDSTFSTGSSSRRNSKGQSSVWDDSDDLVVYAEESAAPAGESESAGEACGAHSHGRRRSSARGEDEEGAVDVPTRAERRSSQDSSASSTGSGQRRKPRRLGSSRATSEQGWRAQLGGRSLKRADSVSGSNEDSREGAAPPTGTRGRLEKQDTVTGSTPTTSSATGRGEDYLADTIPASSQTAPPDWGDSDKESMV